MELLREYKWPKVSHEEELCVVFYVDLLMEVCVIKEGFLNLMEAACLLKMAW